jgi:hypothetical protein
MSLVVLPTMGEKKKRDLDAVNWMQGRDIFSHSFGRLDSREAGLGIVTARFMEGKGTSVHLFF